jgi:hypothetical protein
MSKISQLHQNLVNSIQSESQRQPNDPFKIDCKVGTIQSVLNSNSEIDSDVTSVYIRETNNGIINTSNVKPSCTRIIGPTDIIGYSNLLSTVKRINFGHHKTNISSTGYENIQQFDVPYENCEMIHRNYPSKITGHQANKYEISNSQVTKIQGSNPYLYFSENEYPNTLSYVMNNYNKVVRVISMRPNSINDNTFKNCTSLKTLIMNQVSIPNLSQLTNLKLVEVPIDATGGSLPPGCVVVYNSDNFQMY